MLKPTHTASTVPGRMARNTVWMLLSLSIGVVQGIGMTYVLSRDLGLVAFGKLGLIINSMNIILFAGASVTPNVLRESARRVVQESTLVASGMLVQALYSAPVMLVALGLLALSSGEPSLLLPASILGVSILLRSPISALIAVNLGRERMEWQLLESAQLVLSFIFLVGLVVRGADLYSFPLASLAGVSTLGMIALWTFRRRRSSDEWRPHAAQVNTLALASLTWGAVNLVQQAHWFLEPLLAPALMGPMQVGWFIAGARFMPMVRSLATALNMASLPVFVRSMVGPERRVSLLDVEKFLRYLMVIGFLGTIGLFAFSDFIVALLYPDSFEGAVRILRILSLSVIPMLLHWAALNLLFAGEKHRELIAGYGLAFAVRLALGIWLGSMWEGAGLAMAQVTSDWILAIVLHALAMRAMHLRYTKTLLKTVFCVLVPLLVLTMGAEISVFLTAAGMLGVFALALFVSRAFTLQDLRDLFRPVGG